MPSESPDDGHEVPDPSLSAQVATWLERACSLSIQVAAPGMIITGGAVLLYAVVGTFATMTRTWTPPYPFLSLTTDPYFALLAFLTGLDVCMGTGAIILLYMMHDVETPNDQISVLSAFIGFGFGAGVIRMTLPTVLSLVTAG